MDAVTIFFDLLARTSGERDIDQFARSLTKAGDGAKKSTQDYKTLAQATKSLGVEADKCRAHVATLYKEFAKTGEMGLLREIRKGEQDLKRFDAWTRHLGGGAATSAGFVSRLAGELTNLGKGPKLGAAAAAAAIAVLPGGALVAGAALAGLGIGFVGLGALAVRNSQKVQGALTDLSNAARETFDAAGAVMEDEIAGGLATIHAEVRRLGPDLAEMFDAAAPHVDNLADGVAGFARNAMPGLKHAVSESGVVVDELAGKMPQLGTAVGGAFRDIGDGAEGGAMAVGTAANLIISSVGVIGKTLELTSKGFEFAAEGWKKHLSFGVMSGFVAEANSAKGATDAASEATKRYNAELAKQRAEALQTASALFDLVDAQMQLNAGGISAERAAIAVTRGIDAMTSAVRENGNSLDVNTVKGANNRDNILSIVEASNQGFAANIKRNMSVQAATAIHDRNTGALLANASKLGLNIDQVWALIQSVNKVPASRYSQIGVPGAVQSRDTVKSLDNNIRALKSKEVRAIARGDWSEVVRLRREIESLRNRQIYVTVVTQRRGQSGSASAAEAYKGARGGVLSFAGGGVAQVAGPGTIVQWAEPETGGEAYIPRRGERSRSKQILDIAAGWHGMRVVPMAAGGVVSAREAATRMGPARLMTTSPQIWANASRLIKLIQDAFSGRREGSLIALVTRDSRALTGLANQRAATVKRLAAAQQNLANLTKAAADTRASTAQKVMGTFSLTGGGAGETAGGMIERLNTAVFGAQQFSDRIRALRQRGLAGGLLQQLADAGPEGGNAAALALMRGSGGDIAQINALYGQLGRSANTAGVVVSDALYGAGIRAAQGLVRGLSSQQRAIERQMLAIATAMQTAIKRALGIRSPSTVMAGLGAQVPAGFAKGVAGGTGMVAAAARQMAGAAVVGAGAGTSGGHGTSGGIVIQNLNVNVAPGVNGRQVGAELMTYLRAYEKGGGKTWAPSTS